MRKDNRWTRDEIADLLNVTPSRVSQIASYFRMSMSYNRRGGYGYTAAQLNIMQSRDTKPGPKPERAAKKR